MIPYGRQQINEDDIQAVIDVLRSDWLTQGPCVPRFEETMCKLVNAQFATAVNSATSALHLACLALGVKQGDHVWTSPNSFVASSNCVLYCGASIDFVDIDNRTYNLSIDALTAKLHTAKQNNQLPKVVIAVHFAGQACDMKPIFELSQQYGFSIIEDASHALGGSYKDQSIGCGQFSDITVFSFHPVKIITTGEGGIAVTNNPALHHVMQSLRSHGIEREPTQLHNKNEGPFYYEQQQLGFNYRLTDIQAALGISQLARLPDFITTRKGIAAQYDEALTDLPLILPYQQTNTQSAWHLYVIQLIKNVTITRKELICRLRDMGIFAQVHYIPIHLQPYYQGLGFKKGDFPVCEDYYQGTVSLPIFPDLTKQDQQTVINTLHTLLVS
jgi:UDP-4-amino-4,6-dideoxy-N-acetyl-beta-L-altrosamine transaminase